jgi:hypothetical protein
VDVIPDRGAARQRDAKQGCDHRARNRPASLSNFIHVLAFGWSNLDPLPLDAGLDAKPIR